MWGYLATKKWNTASTKIEMLVFWWMPESFGRKIPMKKNPIASNKNNFLFAMRDYFTHIPLSGWDSSSSIFF